MSAAPKLPDTPATLNFPTPCSINAMDARRKRAGHSLSLLLRGEST